MSTLGSKWYQRYSIYGGIAIALWPFVQLAYYPPWNDTKPHPEKTVIVTGATTDLGKATTYSYARRKCRVIMASNDMDECLAFRRELVLETKSKQLACRYLDLESVVSINKFVDEMLQSEPHIDVLVNNEYIKDHSDKTITKYGVEKHFFINFIAPYLLTLRLLPKLEENAQQVGDARIVNVTGKPLKTWNVKLSDVNFEKRAYSTERAFGQSRLAFAYFTIVLNQTLRERNSKVLVFGNGFNVKKISSSNNTHYKSIWDTAFRRFRQYYYYSPHSLAGVSVKCGLDEGMNANESGKLFKMRQLSYGRNKGWGIAGDDLLKAQQVWNFAAHLLTTLPEEEAEKISDSIKVSEPHDKNKTSQT